MVEDLQDPGSRELTREALSNVPGYRKDDPQAEPARLPGGSVNRSYLVATSAGRFVLRFSAGADAWLASDRSVERELHRIASDAGLAPRIVHADARDRWLITEYLEGRQWCEDDFADPRGLERLARTLRRLHSLPAPEAGRVDLLQVLEGYVRRIGTGASSPLTGLLERAGQAWQIARAADRPVAILHHDLNASNVIENSQALSFIDWECAAVGDPLHDIACILSYYERAAPHAAILLREAGLDSVGPRQVAAAVWLFDLHTYLWYRERRSRMSATRGELEAEQRLAARLAHGPGNPGR